MNDWSTLSFGKGIKLEESAFDTKVGGGKFIDVGMHKDMVISEVELRVSKAGNNYVRLRYENSEGAGISSNIMLNNTENKEGNLSFHWTYLNLAKAVAGGNPTLALKFFHETLPSNGSLFEGLVGLKLNLKVKHGKSGFIIKNDELGGQLLIDVETGEKFEGTKSYADFTEAKDAAEEAGLEQCYNEVGGLFLPSEASREVNVVAIEKLVTSGKAPTAPKTIVSI